MGFFTGDYFGFILILILGSSTFFYFWISLA